MAGKRKILIVDDRVENLVALENTLFDLDVEVFRATNGNEALALSLKNDFAVAVLDVQMPEMDGYELADLLRGDLKTHRLPIIFVTAAYGEQEQIFKGYEAGAVDYLVKPYNPRVLISKISVFLELHGQRIALADKISALAASEERFRSLVMTVPDIVYRVDTQGRFTFLNDAITLLGYAPEDLIGEHFTRIILPSQADEVSRDKVLPKFAGKDTDSQGAPKLFDERRTYNRKTTELEVCLIPKAQADRIPGLVQNIGDEAIEVEINSSGLYSRSQGRGHSVFLGTVGVIRDISERKKAEKELERYQKNLEEIVENRTKNLAHLTQVLRSIRNVNQLIVRENDISILISEACKLLVQERGFKGAWIILTGDGENGMASAQEGYSDKAFEELKSNINLHGLPICYDQSDGSQITVVRDAEVECKGCPFAKEYGKNLVLTAPLRYGDRRFGYFSISMSAEIAVEEEELSLFEEIAGDISFALHNMEAGELRRRAEEEKLEALLQTEGLLAATRSVLATPSIENSARAIFNICAKRIGVDAGYFALLSEDGKYNEVIFLESGRMDCSVDPSLPMPIRGLREVAYKLGKATFDNNFRSSSYWKFMPKGHVDLENVLFAPVILENKSVGLMGFANKPGGFTDNDATIAQAFAEIAAVALRESRTQEELRRSEKKYRKYVENAPEGIFIADAEGRYIDANAAACRMTGYSRDELMNMSMSELASPMASLESLEAFADLKKGDGIDIETILRKKDGSDIFVILAAVKLSDNHFLAFCADITHLKVAEQEKDQLEKQLNQAQKMESIGRLAGGVAHDFNNLLTAIQGFSELVMDSLNENDPIRRDVREIQKAADSAAHLTSQLLAFSRKQIVAPKVMNLNMAVTFSEKMLKRIIGEDIDLVYIRDERLDQVLVDPGQIDQVLINLAVNSRDAMPTGGKLTIETKNVSLDKNRCQTCNELISGDFVMLAISDDGPGMDDETIKNIFEPFFTTKEKGKGTGLGLSTVHGIVHQNNGHINVYSEIGNGTAFKIYLPAIHAELEEIAEKKEPVSLAGNETILVVEDQEIVRKLACRALKTKGYEVIEAQNGGEALISFEKYGDKIDLLLTDVVMPSMSGKELYEKLLKINPHLKTIFMSGYTENAIAHHGVLEAGTNFIQKPFKPNDLVQKVRQVLDAPVPDVDQGGDKSLGAILVVDDEETMRELCSIRLKAMGYEVITAVDGQMGLDAFQNNAQNISLVILDQTMDKMSGTEVLKRIRAIDPDAPVVISSGFGSEEIFESLKDYKGVGFLAKPFRRRDFEEAVSKFRRPVK